MIDRNALAQEMFDLQRHDWFLRLGEMGQELARADVAIRHIEATGLTVKDGKIIDYKAI